MKSKIKYISIAVLIISLAGCASTTDIISKSTASSIPKGATKVIVTSNLSANSLYKKAFIKLAKQNYTIIHSSDNAHQISAKTPIGHHRRGELTVSMLIVDRGNDSAIIISGMNQYNTIYLVGSNEVKWKGMNGSAYKISFAKLVKLAKSFDGTISYSK